MDPLFRKLDGAARQAAEGDPTAPAEVILRVDAVPMDARAQLEQAGLRVHTLSGPVATGVIVAGQLLALAALSFVRRIELSRALFAEK